MYRDDCASILYSLKARRWPELPSSGVGSSGSTLRCSITCQAPWPLVTGKLDLIWARLTVLDDVTTFVYRRMYTKSLRIVQCCSKKLKEPRSNFSKVIQMVLKGQSILKNLSSDRHFDAVSGKLLKFRWNITKKKYGTITKDSDNNPNNFQTSYWNRVATSNESRRALQ